VLPACFLEFFTDVWGVRHASLFSGIGGFDLAAQWMGWENIFQVEIDPFCQKVLAKNFPEVKRYGDIKQFNGTEYRGSVDILTGGFPCQPFSIAGKIKGTEDDRYQWPEMLRVIREVDAPVVVGENVANIKNVALEQILSDLEDAGYWPEVYSIPARSLDADHERQRIWIVAYTKCERLQRYFTERKGVCRTNRSPLSIDSYHYVPNGGNRLEGYRKYLRNDDGLSRGLDKH
jgi:DNA-cytosine methyltransferase